MIIFLALSSFTNTNYDHLPSSYISVRVMGSFGVFVVVAGTVK